MNAGVVKTYGNLSKRNRAGIKPVSITVSIVEDDAPVRGILAEWIRGADGFKCVGVHANAEAALVALPQEKPSVVLMDINLPGMSGIECVRRLKPQMLDTQFMMLTVYEDPDHIFKALSSGASGYMLKRTPRAELLDRDQGRPRRRLADEQQHRAQNRPVIPAVQHVSPAEPDNLSPREREVLELACAWLSLQRNRRVAAHQRADGQHAHPPHLRKAACPLAFAGRRQVHAHSQRRRCEINCGGIFPVNF